MEANPVILVGVDHSFATKQKDANQYETMTAEDTNHFDPNYFPKGKLWQLPDLDLSEYAYRLAKKAFEDRDAKIYDATVQGKLAIFPKITIEEAKKSILTSFIGTMNRTVGPTMYAKALGQGKVGITSAGADLCKDITTYTEVPTGLNITNNCVITVGTSGIPAPTSGLSFTDSTATQAPTWAKPVW